MVTERLTGRGIRDFGNVCADDRRGLEGLIEIINNIICHII